MPENHLKRSSFIFTLLDVYFKPFHFEREVQPYKGQEEVFSF